MIRALAFALLTSVSSKTYERCELAKELKYAYEVPDSELGTWVCIAEHESQYNTSAIGMVSGDGSGDHGIFQINDEFWCSPPGKGWACGLSCAELEDDDIEDDFICAKRIFREHKHLSGDGFNAWAVYKPYCKGQRAQKYVEGCFSETDEVPHPKKKVPTKKVYPWLVSKPSPATPATASATPSRQEDNGHQSRCFIGRTDLDESKGTRTVSSEFSTVAPQGYESAKTVLPTNNIFTSSILLFNGITPVSQPVTNRQTLSRFSNNIPATDGRLSTSPPFNSIKFTSSSTRSPLLSSVSQFTNVGTTSEKLYSPNTYFNSLTPTSEPISNHHRAISTSSNSLRQAPILPRTKPTTVPNTIFPGNTEVTPFASLRTVIGSNNRFISSPERIAFTAPRETSTSDQKSLSQRVQEEPRFIVNGMAWV